MYNLTNVTGAHSGFEFFKAVNDLTGGLYAAMIMLILWLVLSSILSREKVLVGYIISSFALSIIAGLAWIAKLVAFKAAIIPVVFLFLALAYAIVNRNG